MQKHLKYQKGTYNVYQPKVIGELMKTSSSALKSFLEFEDG